MSFAFGDLGRRRCAGREAWNDTSFTWALERQSSVAVESNVREGEYLFGISLTNQIFSLGDLHGIEHLGNSREQFSCILC